MFVDCSYVVLLHCGAMIMTIYHISDMESEFFSLGVGYHKVFPRNDVVYAAFNSLNAENLKGS